MTMLRPARKVSPQSPAEVRKALMSYTGEDEAILHYLDVLWSLDEDVQFDVIDMLTRLMADIPKMGPIMALEVFGATARLCAGGGKRMIRG